MQFNSHIFISVFLPLSLICYFLSNKRNLIFGKISLIISGIVFYSLAGWSSLVVLFLSVVVNYLFAIFIRHYPWKKFFLLFPIVFNICLLLVFKYSDFIIINLNRFFSKDYALWNLALPLGISFFTFQQIAFLVSVYRKEIPADLIDYLVYILYFPKLLMGPLAEPSEFLYEINKPENQKINWDNIASGIKIFCFGLFKKVLIADTFSRAVSWGFNNLPSLSAADICLITLFYTFEIYFDFSGYSDMATGVSLMFNILLPVNFDSPYKAMSIRDFWKRWHISLTKFLTKYIYIPLGGSRKGKILTYCNTLVVFLISGIWHGSNYTFILWGILHGLFSVWDRVSEKAEENVFHPVKWFCTFSVVNLLWLLFRSDSIGQWYSLLKTLFSFQNTAISEGLIKTFLIPETSFISACVSSIGLSARIRGFWMLFFCFIAFVVCLVPENNYKNLHKVSLRSIIFAVLAFVCSFLCLSSESVFVYFNF